MNRLYSTFLIVRIALAGSLNIISVPALSGEALNDRSNSRVTINLDLQNVSHSAEKSLLGFNIVWMNFQKGYWRNGRVRPEIIEWMKYFPGAVYRYPGGTEANYFEWSKAVGPISTRLPQKDSFNRAVVSQFGFEEYINFVKQVRGLPLVVANLSGGDTNAFSVVYRNVELTKRLNGNVDADSFQVTHCESGKPCPVKFWELGNELDWKGTDWTAENYAAVCQQVIQGMVKVTPEIRFIANSATAPWSRPELASQFNKAVGSVLRDRVSGFSFHPYYDGITITRMKQWMESVEQDIGGGKSKTVPLYITEHGRWPKKPLLGEWKKHWHETGDLGGALSSADFLLMLAEKSNVKMAVWHSLGSDGPWQLFYLDEKSDNVFPNVVYWAFRVIQNGWLDEILNTEVVGHNGISYSGGYDIRAISMKSTTDDRFSLLIVNRGPKSEKTKLHIKDKKKQRFEVNYNYVSGKSLDEANVAENKNNVVMQSRNYQIVTGEYGDVELESPPYSVMSYVFEPVQ